MPQKSIKVFTMTKKIYLSLPISHFDLEERKAFAEEREKYLSHFYEVVNPLKNGISQEEHWSVHMRRDIQMLLECDMIYMAKGWQWSKGCKLEHDIATTCGIAVWYEENSWMPEIPSKETVTENHKQEDDR